MYLLHGSYTTRSSSRSSCKSKSKTGVYEALFSINSLWSFYLLNANTAKFVEVE